MNSNGSVMSGLHLENADNELFHGCSCLFTIPDYWEYGVFTPRERCALPGHAFQASANGAPDGGHIYFAPADEHGVARQYTFENGPYYAAWRVRVPSLDAPAGQYGLVGPLPGPWRVWCVRTSADTLCWQVETCRDETWSTTLYSTPAPGDPHVLVQVAMTPHAITLSVNGQLIATIAHDPYTESFAMTFGSGQPVRGGAEVVTVFREVFFHTSPYPDSVTNVPEGPAGVHPGDQVVCYTLCPATPACPRHSEGDVIVRRDGSVLLAWTEYFAGAGWDGSPARIACRVSPDRGATWGESRVLVEREPDANVMSVSLLRAYDGDLLLTCHEQLPGMAAKGMVLRRSVDDGETWGEAICITPNDGWTHAANNACLVRLDSGRIVLACRAYVDGVRRPYALLSDDDGRTWWPGQYVPDPPLTAEQRRRQNVNEPSIAPLADGRLLMTMRTVAGGQYFAWSQDEGETWSIPILSPLRGCCAPAVIRRIPSSSDVLAIWERGYIGRTPLVSAISHDDGATWEHIKEIERSQYHGYGYSSVTFLDDEVLLTYMHFPLYASVMRFSCEPGYIDLRVTRLPLAWFYTDMDT